jgi:hypothetical protein
MGRFLRMVAPQTVLEKLWSLMKGERGCGSFSDRQPSQAARLTRRILPRLHVGGAMPCGSSLPAGTIHFIASLSGTSAQIFLICGMKFSARVIGPETSCRKKMV